MTTCSHQSAPSPRTGRRPAFPGHVHRYEGERGRVPAAVRLSGLTLRLLEQHATTLRWATWAEQVIAGWEDPLTVDTAWGIEALRESDRALDLDQLPRSRRRNRPRAARGAPPRPRGDRGPERRRPVDELEEVVVRDPEQGRRLLRRRGGGARAAVEQRDLAEEFARSQEVDRPAFPVDLHRPGDDEWRRTSPRAALQR